MRKERKEGFTIMFVGLFACLLSTFFIIGPGAKGVGVVWFLPLPGFVWGWLFLIFGVLFVVGGIVSIVKG